MTLSSEDRVFHIRKRAPEIMAAEAALIADVENAGLTMCSWERSWATISAMRYVDNAAIGGDVVECGVWKGGQMLLARSIHNRGMLRHFWLFDTFSGMTEPGPEDASRKGGSAISKYESRLSEKGSWLSVPLNEVQEIFRQRNLFDGLLHFIKGPVERTLRENLVPKRIALVRLDTDWYASTKVELEVLWPRLSPGGVMLVDDYGQWQGCQKAVDEYFIDKPHLMVRTDSTGRVIIKPPC